MISAVVVAIVGCFYGKAQKAPGRLHEPQTSKLNGICPPPHPTSLEFNSMQSKVVTLT